MRRLALALAIAGCHGHGGADAVAQIIVDAHGHAAELEQTVAIPLEQALAPIEGRTSTRTLSEDDHVVITVTASGDRDVLRQRIITQLATVRGLPDDVAPVLGPMTTPDGVLVRYALGSTTAPAVQLRTWNDTLVRRAMLQVPGVAEVSACGGEVAAIRVHVAATTLAELGLGLRDVEAALAAASTRGGATGRPLALSADELKVAIVGISRGSPVRLGDVARIEDAGAPPTCVALDDRGAVVVGTVWLRAGASRSSTRDAVDRALADVSKALPPGTAVTVLPADDRGELALPPGATFEQVSPLLRAIAARAPAAVIELGRDDGGFERDDSDAARVLGGSDGATAALAREAPPGTQWRDASASAAWVILRGGARDQLAAVLAQAPPELRILARIGADDEPQYRYEIDRDRAASFGVDVSGGGELAEVLAVARHARAIGTVVGAHDLPEDILLDLDPGRELAAASLDRLTVAGTGGARVPLSQLVRVTEVAAPISLLRVDGQREVEARIATDDVDALRAQLATRVHLPAGVTLVVERR